jgi:Ni/Co efflux regulator RcnB
MATTVAGPTGRANQEILAMKKILTAAVVFALLGGTAALAQPYGGQGHNNGHDDRAQGPRGPQGHNWSRGQRLPSTYRDSRHAVDYRQHHLRAPPRGYRWQQVDNNYVLAAVASGLIADIVAGR